MFKMMKYEYKRAWTSLKLLLLIIAAVEALFLVTVMSHKDSYVVLSIMLLTFLGLGSYLFVLIYGIRSYSSDLKNKSGYLVFMTPLSTYKILGAKLLAIFLTAMTLIGVFGVLFTFDFEVFASEYNFEGFLKAIFELFNEIGGINIARGLLILLAYFISILIQFYMVMTVAYLAMSLSATMLQNKKIKGVVSFVLFTVIYGLVNALSVKIMQAFTEGESTANLTAGNALLRVAPSITLYLVVAFLCYIACAKLLEKSISL